MSQRRPNILFLDNNNRTKDENNKGHSAGGGGIVGSTFGGGVNECSRSAPTTPCSITRRTAVSPQRSAAAAVSPQHSPLFAVAAGNIGAGSVSPNRRRSSAPRALTSTEQQGLCSSLNRAAQLLIEAQLERKNNLEKELEKDKRKLEAMQQRTLDLKARLAARNSSMKKAALSEEVAALRADCTKLFSELDSSPDGENFKPSGLEILGAAGGERNEGPHWRCHICTFQNHPLLNQCESCTMPRIILEGSETPNIHIHVTHHKFPSCKVVHSWAI